MIKLDIVSVSYYSYEYFAKNWLLTTYYNTDIDINWILIQNTPEPECVIPHVTMIPGVKRPQEPFIGSNHHGLALNKSLRYLSKNSDYVLFLDPDFYIFPKLSECIGHIQQNDLAVFGAPYQHKNKLPDILYPWLNKTDKGNYKNYYSDETRQMVQEKYKNTLDYLGYSF